jgi:UDP-N-acetylmuramate dehydrogenase
MHDSNSENLKSLHTFHLDVYCKQILEITRVDQIQSVFASVEKPAEPFILGKGSNVLFVEDYPGTVILNRISGIEVTSTADETHIHAGGGEDWPAFVEAMVKQGIGGFENLAMIPGCVGSSPIQNIGAYGVELESLCTYVDYYDLISGEQVRLDASECQFGYRDSIFKHALKDRAFITAVGFTVPKTWQPTLNYGALAANIVGEPSIEKVFNAVCETRMSKLPNPDEIGNAGSFFKNPIIAAEHYQQLQERFPNIVGYPQKGGVKVAAGWLIDNAGLKGRKQGGAQVHPHQALVLTNTGSATPADVILLAESVRQKVLERFSISLEHEVRFIGAQGETTLDATVKSI